MPWKRIFDTAQSAAGRFGGATAEFDDTDEVQSIDAE